MTHFNHDYTGESPNAVGDRYYAQDLNDDFNYIKHLPYEMIYKGKNGVIIHPTYEYDDSAKTYTFRGGVGAYNTACTVVDTSKTWTIPPAVKSEMRYERVEFKDSVVDVSSLTNTMAFLVVSPTKKSLLSRTKALVATPYETRINYEGQITIATSVSADQIVLGLVSNDSIMLYSPVQNKKNTIMLDVCDCRMTNFETDDFADKISEPFGWTADANTAIECADIRFEYDIPIEIPLTLKNSVVTGGLATVNRAENCDFSKCTVSVVDGGECINCNIRNISSSESSDAGMFKNCQIKMTAGTTNLVGIFINCNIDCNDAMVYPDSKFMNCRIVANSLIQEDGSSGSTFIGCDIDCTNARFATDTTNISLYSTLERCTIQTRGNIDLYNYKRRYIDSCEIRCNGTLNIDGTTSDSDRIRVTNSHFYTLKGITAKGDYYINCTFEESYIYGDNISFSYSRLDNCTIITQSYNLKKTMLTYCICESVQIQTYFTTANTALISGGSFFNGSWIQNNTGRTNLTVTTPLIINSAQIRESSIGIDSDLTNNITEITGVIHASFTDSFLNITGKYTDSSSSNCIISSNSRGSYIRIGQIEAKGAIISRIVAVDMSIEILYGKVGVICAYGAINTTISLTETTVTIVVGTTNILMPCVGVILYNIYQSTATINKNLVLNGSNWSEFNIMTNRWLSMDKTARAVVS